MVSEGPNNPSTMADDSAVGDTAWVNPDNAKASDNVYATADLTDTPGEHIIKIVKGGTVQGDDKADTLSEFPTTEAIITYGGASDLWGLSWTAQDINASNFGVVISIQGDGGDKTSHFLKATNFGFSIPLGATIDGITVEMEQHDPQTGLGRVDHMKITIDYTGGMKINIGDNFKNVVAVKINIGDVWKDVDAMKINIGDVWKVVF